jgi:glycine/D-amino acid oxidase-like deaminating enzyme
MAASSSSPHVAVFGAGVFGGWTALSLLERGARVTLVDAWGPGNVRSSSGGSTRVIRATYGSHQVYTRMARQALQLWKAYDARWRSGLLQQTGALWLFREEEGFGLASTAALEAEGIALEEISVAEAVRRFPQVRFDGITRVLVEPDAGYLYARRACQRVARQVGDLGGTLLHAAAASPTNIEGRAVTLADGSSIEADAFVFACGPWLGSMFPGVIGSLVTATRQDVYFFGQPSGDARFQAPALPVWLECGDRFIYGIPGDGSEGFKIADDTAGPQMNPTTDERAPDPDGVDAMRRYLRLRFPALADAPLVRSEVCQYEATPDSHFIVDRHPSHERVWLVGGGSGHGFKMGPVIGQIVASLVLGETSIDPQFALTRFAAPPAAGWRPKWA